MGKIQFNSLQWKGQLNCVGKDGPTQKIYKGRWSFYIVSQLSSLHIGYHTLYFSVYAGYAVTTIQHLKAHYTKKCCNCGSSHLLLTVGGGNVKNIVCGFLTQENFPNFLILSGSTPANHYFAAGLRFKQSSFPLFAAHYALRFRKFRLYPFVCGIHCAPVWLQLHHFPDDTLRAYVDFRSFFHVPHLWVNRG